MKYRLRDINQLIYHQDYIITWNDKIMYLFYLTKWRFDLSAPHMKRFFFSFSLANFVLPKSRVLKFRDDRCNISSMDGYFDVIMLLTVHVIL